MSHYIAKIYGLTCDVNGCSEAAEHLPLSTDGLRETRRVLAEQGWTRHHGKDVCPKQDDRHDIARPVGALDGAP